ncbi:MAG: antitoxin of toxin-antitoxin stability system [Oenococcus sp.]|uniref:Antitoxin of toxin-antitoxin system n=1 Tax=Oenococcus kitaharae DSM 17330 TaxID=1045004 RepID=G9WIY2_9LACO|nr:hypothetical protein [Oenococcus kitaharae]EHN58431.1 Antitoxin of toxin-antitoxin system [Oenococcus kitaharae DSM 17330]MCV3296330.1 antitoxin of toxin-antitoxin stability system [Oenococcus kitaharae]OEY81410.1 antitoxin of toxin-antitoxin stability system [Oenococcus kitaharae]OEY82898.1 antitoxin of toxin-antitoxin stability system [Oenococcus kitaharae]OEY84558.1 antitoxin of toxin-antitoxin stability system [Oenococcus kitaharae]
MIGATVKIRKSGNSNILTLPKEIKPTAKEFTVFQGRDGEIVYTPKKTNPFKDEKWVQAHEHLTQKEAFGGSDFDTEFSD